MNRFEKVRQRRWYSAYEKARVQATQVARDARQMGEALAATERVFIDLKAFLDEKEQK